MKTVGLGGLSWFTFSCFISQNLTTTKNCALVGQDWQMYVCSPLVRLTADQERKASEVGQWLDDYVSWAGHAANETPLRFHEGAGLWLAALAIGRCLYIHTPWRQKIHPNLYIMLVAVQYSNCVTCQSRVTKSGKGCNPWILLILA